MPARIRLDLQAIIEAAIEMADAQGLEEVTLASLAQKLKIRPPSLYNHINGLQGLRTKLAIHGLKQLNIQMTQAAVGRSGDEAVRAMGEAYVSFARANPGLYEATLRAPHLWDEELTHEGEQVVGLVVRVLQHYDLEEKAMLHAVRGFRSALHGFASLEQRGGFGLPLDLNDTLQFILDTFLAGIHKMKEGRNK